MSGHNSIWEFQCAVSRRLLAWSGISTAVGLVLHAFGAFARGVGGQFVGWAVINAAIAVGGSYATEQRKLRLPTPDAPAVLLKEAAGLRRLLWINAGLDILYMLGGLWAMRGEKPYRRGMGLGIFFQGLFLFVFDIVHALGVPMWPWRGSDPRG